MNLASMEDKGLLGEKAPITFGEGRGPAVEEELLRGGGGAGSSQWRSREGRWIEAAWAVTNLSFSTATLRLHEKFSFSVTCL
jgi:hypothetical protein